MEMYISGAAALSSVASRLAWKLQVSVDKDELQARVLSSGVREWRQWWEAQVAGEEETAYRAGQESCVVCGIGLEVVGKGRREEARETIGGSEELVCHGRCLSWGLRHWRADLLKLKVKER